MDSPPASRARRSGHEHLGQAVAQRLPVALPEDRSESAALPHSRGRVRLRARSCRSGPPSPSSAPRPRDARPTTWPRSTSYNALLLRRIRGGHATLELEREQFQVQQQIADVLKQQAEAQGGAARDQAVSHPRLRPRRRGSRSHGRDAPQATGQGGAGATRHVPGHEEDAVAGRPDPEGARRRGRRHLRGRALERSSRLIDDLKAHAGQVAVDVDPLPEDGPRPVRLRRRSRRQPPDQRQRPGSTGRRSRRRRSAATRTAEAEAHKQARALAESKR